jgi:glyoxylate utilization-related uncharacterized protein
VITVLDINSIPVEALERARVAAFLTEETVGAQRVRGELVELDPDGSLGPYDGAGDYQLFYVTEGEPTASLADETHHLRRGQGIYCDRHESCAIENTSGKRAKFLRFVVHAEQEDD